MREQFSSLLRQEIERTVGSKADVERELQYFITLFQPAPK